MDIRDILQPPDGLKRPEHPDFWRISEVSLQLRTDIERLPFDEKEKAWRARISSVGDFDSIAYHAIQVAMSIMSIRTVADWATMRRDGRKQNQYLSTVQAFYDGFMMGALYEQRGGHQEP